MVRQYPLLRDTEQTIAASMAASGASQQKIAKKIGIAKQSVATFLKRAGLGKRRPWSPTGKVVRVNADGWQLTLVATFEHIDTGEIKGNIYCYSHFHAVKNHPLAYKECLESGQATCAGDYGYEDDNAMWIPIYVYKESWIRWRPKD